MGDSKMLPVKSLMRFKCVSKLWRSIILDPRFAREYRGGFRGLLVTDPFFSRLSPTNNFFYINLFDDDLSGDRLIAYHHTVNHSGRRLGFTEVVNGLLCFYCGNYSCLYNLATREGRDLPLSQDENESCTYHLGFDPVNNLYKLLKICAIYEGYDYEGPFAGDLDEVTLVRNLNCETLTLGVDALWRSIDPAPEEMTSKGVCFNGVLYWIIPGIELVDDNDSLFAFDLAQEKFQSFTRPQGFSGNYLPLFAPVLALFEVQNSSTAKEGLLSVYDNNGGGQWTVHKFNLPLGGSCNPVDGAVPIGILPDGQVLISRDGNSGVRCPAPVYLYNLMEKKMKMIRIVIREPPSSLYKRTVIIRHSSYQTCIDGHISYLEENIMPLNCLTIPSSSSAA